MTELSFTKSVLNMLTSRPPRLPLTHCEDPQKLPARPPYTLPRHLPPPPPAYSASPSSPGKSSLTPGAVPSTTSPSPTVSITIKPLRPTPGLSPLPLPTASLSSTILTLKAAYSKHTGLDMSKLRLLLKGKPVADVKTLGELGLGDSTPEEGGVVFSVMVIGKIDPEELKRNKEEMEKKEQAKAATAAPAEKAAEPEQHQDKKRKVMLQDEFWGDLKGFLDGKLGGEEDSAEVLKVFREAWGRR